jgi:hypothetical protein
MGGCWDIVVAFIMCEWGVLGCDVVKVVQCDIKDQCCVGEVGINLGAKEGGQVGVCGCVGVGVSCCAGLADVGGGLFTQVLLVCVMSEVA